MPSSTGSKRSWLTPARRRVPAIDTPLTSAFRAAPPRVHGGGECYFGLAWPALEWLERNVTAEMTTLETGTGVSTIVFAARGASHTAISPARDEHERIARESAARGVSLERVRFVAEPSHVALQHWTPEPLDVVLIDGAHAFPYPILDWFWTAPHLRIGGHLLLDDAQLAAVNVLVRFLREDPAWRLAGAVGYRTVRFTRVRESAGNFEWMGSAFERRVRFDYLPPARRLVASARHRLLDRSPLGRFATAIRRRP